MLLAIKNEFSNFYCDTLTLRLTSLFVEGITLSIPWQCAWHTVVPWTLTSGSTTTTASPGVGTAAHNRVNGVSQRRENKKMISNRSQYNNRCKGVQKSQYQPITGRLIKPCQNTRISRSDQNHVCATSSGEWECSKCFASFDLLILSTTRMHHF